MYLQYLKKKQKRIVIIIVASMLSNSGTVVFGEPHQLVDASSMIMPQEPAAQDRQILIGPGLFDGLDIKAVIASIIHDADERGMLDDLPEAMILAYVSLQEGAESLSLQHLAACLPLITEKVMQMVDMNNNALVDKAARPTDGTGSCASLVGVVGCDLTQVLAGLAKLKALIIHDFAATWTILAHLQDTVTACCTDLTATIKTDFAETWTVLADIKATFTTCCQEIQDDFVGTWTFIQGCCDTIENNFQATWTILANLPETDLSGIYTAIVDVKETIETDFADTWTMIQGCCNTIENNFQATWTILASLPETDLSGVYTAIAALNFDVTVSCDLSGIYTAIADIKETIETCCDNIETSFQATWTILANLEFTCSATTDLSGVYTALDACCSNITKEFQQTWTILAATTLCGATPITAPMTITVPGTYCVANDIAAAGTVITINVPATVFGDVILDLNGHQLSRTATGDVILVSGRQSNITIRNGYVLTGGTGTSNGIRCANSNAAGSNSTNITIEQVAFNHTSQTGTKRGLRVDSGAASPLRFMTVRNCTFLNGDLGIDMSNASEVVIENCYLRGHESHGITMSTVDNVAITDCMSTGNTGSGINGTTLTNTAITNCNLTGNTSSGINGTTLTGCIVIGCTVNANGASGIVINDIFNSTIKNNICSSNTGTGFGINMLNDSLTSSNLIIEGNLCAQNTAGGISCRCEHVIFADNECTRNGNTTGAIVAVYGILSIGGGCVFTGNDCTSNFVTRTAAASLEAYGIKSTGASTCEFIKNVCDDNLASFSQNTTSNFTVVVHGIHVIPAAGGTYNLIDNICRHNQANVTTGTSGTVVTVSGITEAGANVCTILRNVCNENTAQLTGGATATVYGINTASNGCKLSGNTCNNNAVVSVSNSGATTAYGINASGDSVIGDHNTCNGNRAEKTGATEANPATAHGININGPASTLEKNICNNNESRGPIAATVTNSAYGIRLRPTADNCSVLDNTCNNNTNIPTLADVFNGDGIIIENTSSGNNVFGNVCNNNKGTGINKVAYIDSCSFSQNKAAQNGTNYSTQITSLGNDIVIQYNVSTGQYLSFGGGAAIATIGAPWANLSIV